MRREKHLMLSWVMEGKNATETAIAPDKLSGFFWRIHLGTIHVRLPLEKDEMVQHGTSLWL